MNKNREILEIKKLYLIQFEKFETKVYFSWISLFFGLFLAWIYGRVDGYLVIIVAIFTCFLDRIIDCWRKSQYNKVIDAIRSGNAESIT